MKSDKLKKKYPEKDSKQIQKNSLLRKLTNLDIIVSTIVHKHESLLLTILLFPPAVLFNPKCIALAILYIAINFNQGFQYLFCMLMGLFVSTLLKKQIGRIRPNGQNQLILKPMILRNNEFNHSMPSGDSIQAGIFLIFYLQNITNEENEFIKFTIIMTMFNVLLARVYFCCHYFLDTIVGFLIGITISFIFNLMI